LIQQHQRLNTVLTQSLTIASVQLDNNGTYYCDVTNSVPGVNPYFVPEEYTKITVFVTGIIYFHRGSKLIY